MELLAVTGEGEDVSSIGGGEEEKSPFDELGESIYLRRKGRRKEEVGGQPTRSDPSSPSSVLVQGSREAREPCSCGGKDDDM